MRCPKCTVNDDKVIDSRPHNDAVTVRRRHECKACHHRWSAIEVSEEVWQVMLDIVGTQLAIDAEKPGLAEKSRKVLGMLFRD